MLEGTLVRLRALELEDLERVYRWANDREVTRYVVIRYPVSRREEERWLRASGGNGLAGVRLAIETKDGAHIGNIDLHGLSGEDRSAALGIMIGEKAYWSNGYGRDAVETVCRVGFEELNLHRISLHVFEFNERAIACYRRCGFVEEGRLRDHYYGQGRYWDVLVMAVLKPEFEARRGEARAAT